MIKSTEGSGKGELPKGRNFLGLCFKRHKTVCTSLPRFVQEERLYMG
jgi:hypothetical protein